MIPTESSTGENSVRANVSERISRMAPSSAEAAGRSGGRFPPAVWPHAGRSDRRTRRSRHADGALQARQRAAGRETDTTERKVPHWKRRHHSRLKRLIFGLRNNANASRPDCTARSGRMTTSFSRESPRSREETLEDVAVDHHQRRFRVQRFDTATPARTM